MKKQRAQLFLITDAKGQAVIESIFLLPFMIVFFIFIYQSFLILNKAQIAQKALRGSVIRSTLNRYDVETVSEGFLNTNSSPNGKFAFSYIDNPQAGVIYSVDSIVASLILLFASKEQESKLELFLKELVGPMSLGVCLGGKNAIGESIDEKALTMQGSTPFTCVNNQK